MSIPTLICGDRVAFGVIRHGTVKHAYKPLVSVPGDYNVLVAWDDGALLSHRASTLETSRLSKMTDVLRYAENVTCPDIRPIIAQASYDYNGWYGSITTAHARRSG